MLRLSAIGDVVQVVPTIRALQRKWPDASFTWLMGSGEAHLLGDLDDVEIVPFRKKDGWKAIRALARHLRSRRFDTLLHMQPSLRANLLSRVVAAPIRLGFDAERSRELHGLFVNERIAPGPEDHVLESFFSFARSLGVDSPVLRWEIPLSEEDRRFARAHLPDGERCMVISPCSSHTLRNWSPERYARVAAHAVDQHRMRIVICGSPTETERAMADAISRAIDRPVTNLVGRDTLKRLLAVLERATVVLSPDSGPAHMASAVGTPVIGLHAATRSARSGPYRSLQWCVDVFSEAAGGFRGRPEHELPWAEKIEEPGVMDLIEVAPVVETLDRLVEEMEEGREVVSPPRIRETRWPQSPAGR